MKVRVEEDDLHCFYTLSTKYGDEMEVPDELIERYPLVMRAFADLQKELRDICGRHYFGIYTGRSEQQKEDLDSYDLFGKFYGEKE